MDLSIITVTYNSKDNIADQIRSVILASDGIDFEQIVVDNCSSDGTVDFIKKEFPRVRVIENKKNFGFGAANNQGVKESRGHYVLFLNPDMKFLDQGCLTKWVGWMDAHPETAISGCKLLNAYGALNMNAMPRRFPKLLEILAIFCKLPHIFPKMLNGYLYRDRDFSKEQEVDSLRGSCMLVRLEFIEKLGRAFDERYFIWFEDVDLCREAKKMGYKISYAPIVSCVDFIGRSFKKKPLLWKQWQFAISAAKYFMKWRVW